jgi:hypothetical protein
MIGKVIKHLLDDSTALNILVPTANKFPYVINENTPLPALVYTVDSLEPQYDKDGWVYDACTFSVVTFSDNYALLQSVVLEVRKALELMSGTNEGITTNNIYLDGQFEGYNITEDVFMNKLTFTVEITDY